MRLLTETPDASLRRGDVIRLAHDYDGGPGSGSVDLMVYEPHADDAGMGLIVISGYKAGSTLSIFPTQSCGAGRRTLETAWLLANWNDWFCFTYLRGERDRLVPVPVEGTLLIAWDEREIVLKT